MRVGKKSDFRFEKKNARVCSAALALTERAGNRGSGVGGGGMWLQTPCTESLQLHAPEEGRGLAGAFAGSVHVHGRHVRFVDDLTRLLRACSRNAYTNLVGSCKLFGKVFRGWGKKENGNT